jgi:hypothetical protein
MYWFKKLKRTHMDLLLKQKDFFSLVLVSALEP